MNKLPCRLVLAALFLAQTTGAQDRGAPAKACDVDTDADGINDCQDKCPVSRAGEAIGPDGCAVPLVIDLKGVSFDFGSDALRADAIANLDEDILLLGKYPELRVEVAGHADAVGGERDNRNLAARRARVVYAYLVEHGIDARRLLGPTGYGDARPVAPNTRDDGSDNPEGRARNRRTELNLQD